MKNTIIKAVRYNPIDIELTGTCKLDNPFYARLEGEFLGPEGQKIVIPGFYDGDAEPAWKVRFSPTAVGTWTYEIHSEDIVLEVSEGTVQCSENMNSNIHGSLKVDADYPHHFIHEDGVHRFVMPYECNWLWAMDMDETGENKAEALINTIKQYGFNEILMNIYAHSCHWTEERRNDPNNYGCPGQYLWEGTNEHPDHSRMNLAFFKLYDKVMDLLLREGIQVHMYFKVYNKAVNWPAKYSKEEDMFFKYVTARYQAYCNVMWDFSKETYNEEDKEYIKNRLCLVKQNDGYNRLTTVHDDPIFYNDDKYASVLDFQTLQQHDDFYTYVLWQREKRAWPVINAEFSYEHGPGGIDDVTWPNSNTAEEVIYRAYETVMAGGYPAYYYTYTAWDMIDFSYQPRGYRYMKIMYDFFTSIDWWKLEPNNEVCCWRKNRCLEEAGEQYIFFLTNQTMLNMEIDLTSYQGYWMNIYTGEKTEADLLTVPQASQTGRIIVFRSPIKDVPVVLHIKKK